MKLYKTEFLSGVKVPSSKSEVIRLLICASLSDKPTVIICSKCDDTDTCASCLPVFGAVCESFDKGYRVIPSADGKCLQDFIPDFGYCAAALRMMYPLAMLKSEGKFEFKAAEKLLERIKGTLPAYEELSSGCVHADLKSTSQTVSGLLFAFSLFGGRIVLNGNFNDSPYLSLTLAVMKRFGINDIEISENTADIKSDDSYISPGTLVPEGDWSAAAYPLIAGCIGSHPVKVSGIYGNSLQGDSALIDILRKNGGKLSYDGEGWTAYPSDVKLRSEELLRYPDLVPPLSVLAAACKEETELYIPDSLRIKESDRIKSVCDMINCAGGKACYVNHRLVISGPPKGGRLPDTEDHRIFMSYVLLSMLCCEPVYAENPACVSKSFPDFLKIFRSNE